MDIKRQGECEGAPYLTEVAVLHTISPELQGVLSHPEFSPCFYDPE